MPLLIKVQPDHTVFRAAGFVPLSEWQSALTANLTGDPKGNRLLVDASAAAHTRTTDELKQLASLIGRHAKRCAVRDANPERGTLAQAIAGFAADVEAEIKLFPTESEAVDWLREG